MAEFSKKGYHGLPQDILREILSRLRVKTLCKFKCVCKQWEKLISDPYFHVLHHQQSQKKPMLLFLDSHYISCSKETHCISYSGCSYGKEDFFCIDLDGGVNHSMSLPRLPSCDEYFEAVPSSCRNVICMVTQRSFFLCNPSIQAFVKLPEPACNLPEAKPLNLYYPSKRGGFGFMAAKNEYVIIYLTTDHKATYIGYEILYFSAGNLDSCSWRKVDKKCPYKYYGFQPWGTFVDEAFYWKLHKHENQRIISFNLRSENFETLPPPQGLSSALTDRTYLAEHKGQLAFVNISAKMMELWTLKGPENNTWTKDLSIEVFGYGIECFNLVGEVDGEILILRYKSEMNSVYRTRKLWYYNRHRKNFRELENIDIPVEIIHL